MAVKSTKQEAATEAPAPKQENKTANRDSVPIYVYVGPSLPSGLLKRYSTLKGTLEEIKGYYKDLFEPYPAFEYAKIEKLLIPLSKLPKVKIDVEKTGTLYHSYYTDIENMVAEARKEQGEKNGGAK